MVSDIAADQCPLRDSTIFRREKKTPITGFAQQFAIAAAMSSNSRGIAAGLVAQAPIVVQSLNGRS
jgi:hypothetical protein